MTNACRRLLKRWFSVAPTEVSRGSRKHRMNHRFSSLRPRVEMLEDRLAPATSVNINAAQISYGVTSNVNVRVTSDDGRTPTGSVTLSVDSGAPVTQSLIGDTTTFALPGLNAGNHPLQATYNPTGSFPASSGTGEEQVLKVSPALTLSDGGAGWSYPLPASYTISASIAGIDGVPAASLEGVSPTLDYFSGLLSDPNSLIWMPTAPTEIGNYVVQATFDGSLDYWPAYQSQSFAIIDPGAVLTGSNAASATGGVEVLNEASLLNATFTYTNLSATTSNFSTSIDWGDGTPADPGATISGSDGSFTVNGSHLYSTQGLNNFTITVTDGGGQTALITGTADVADAPLIDVVDVPFTPFKGQDFDGTVASFTDTNAGSLSAPTIDATDYSAVITWGDGSATPGTIAYAGTPGQFTINASGTPHRYAHEGLQAGNFHVTLQHGSLSDVHTPAIPVLVADRVPVVSIDGLQFTTSGDFLNLGGVYTTSDDVQVGFSPDAGGAFTPIATLAGGTTINANDETFFNDGAVSESLSGDSIVVSTSGFVASSSIANLVDPAGEGIPFAGETLLVGSSPFDLGALSFALGADGTPEIHMQGQLTLPGGLSITAGPTNYVNLDEAGLVQAGSSSGPNLSGSLTVGAISILLPDLSITDSEKDVGGSKVNVFTISGDSLITVSGLPSVSAFISGSVTTNTFEAFSIQLEESFSFELAGGVTVTSLDTNPLTFTYSKADDSFTISGGAEVVVPGLSDHSFLVTATGTIVGGTLQTLQFTVGSHQTLHVAGVTVITSPDNPVSLTFQDFLTAESKLIVQGGASVDVPGLSSSIAVTAEGTVSDGTLQSLEMNLASDGSFTMNGVTISPQTMSLNYLAADGEQLAVTGTASIEVPGISNPFLVTASGTVGDLSGTVQLKDLSLALASDQTLTVAGVTIVTSTDNPLTFSYVPALSDQFTLTGGARVTISQLGAAFEVTAAGMVSANVLQSLTLTVSAYATLNVHGLTVSPTSLYFSYLRSAGNQFVVGGHAIISIAKLGNDIDTTATGVVSNNTLQSLNLALASTPFMVAGIILSHTSYSLTYTPTLLTLTGGATLTTPGTTGEITVMASGTVSNTLQTLTLTASSTASFTLGRVTFEPTDLTFTYVATSDWFHMDGAGSAVFPIFDTIELEFAGNVFSSVLTDFTITVTAATTYTLAGVGVEPTRLTISYVHDVAGDTFNLGGSATVRFPVLGTYYTTIDSTILNDVLTKLAFHVTSNKTPLPLAGGVSVTPISMTFTFQQLGANDQFTAAGTVSIAIPKLGDIVTSLSGVVLNDMLETITFTASSATASFTVGNTGVTIFPRGLILTYTTAGDSFTVGGSASVQFPRSLGSLDVTASGNVSNNTLTSFKLTQSHSNNAPWAVMPGVSFTPRSLALTYIASPQQLIISGKATVVVDLLKLSTDVSVGGRFANNSLQSLFVEISNASFVRLDASLPIGSETQPRIQGNLSGRIVISLTGLDSTPHLVVSGGATSSGADRLAFANLRVSDIPGLTNGPYNVGFSLGVNSAGVIDQATLELTGTVTVSFMNIFNLQISNPRFSYQANPALLSLSGYATATLAGFAAAVVSLGDATRPGLVWKNGALESAYLKNFNATISIPNVGSVNISNFTFKYQPTESPILTAGGQIQASILGITLPAIQVPVTSFTNGTLGTVTVPNINFSFAGLTLKSNSVRIGVGVDLISRSPTLTVSGNGSLTLAGATMNATLGSGSTPGLTFKPGSASPTQAYIKLNGDLGLPGILTLHAAGIVLSYNATSGTFEVPGGGSASIDVLGIPSVQVTMGDSSHPGLSFLNGILQSVNVTLTAGAKLPLAGVMEVTPRNGLTLSYDKSSGTLQLYGGVTAAFAALPSVRLNLELGNASNPGLLIKDGSVVSINAKASGSLTFSGLTLAGLEGGLAYKSGKLSIWGDAGMQLPGLANLDVALGSESNPGLVIQHYALTQFVMTVTGTLHLPGDLLTVKGGLTISFQPAHHVPPLLDPLFGTPLPGTAFDAPDRFVSTGTAQINVLNTLTVNAQVGQDLEYLPGIEIRNGSLYRLQIGISESFSVFGLILSAGISGTYGASNNSFLFTGKVSVQTPPSTPLFGQVTLAEVHGKLYVSGEDSKSSYVMFSENLFGKEVGVQVGLLSGKFKVVTGDPIPLTYDPTAPFMESPESLALAYGEASNGGVDPEDVYVTNDQLVSWYQQKTTALARATELVSAGVNTITSGPSLAITDLVQQGAGADAPGSMLFKVRLTNPPTTGPVTVHYTTVDEAALANVDYVPQSGTLTWLPGQTEQTIPVPIFARTEAVPHKLFKVILSNPTGAGVASSVGVGDILYSHFLTSTAVTSSAANSIYGQDVTFTATVTNNDPVHSPGIGIVHFFDGDAELGKVALVNGHATLTVPELKAGSHSITVKYTGWQIPGYSYLESTSAVLQQFVAGAAQTLTFATLADQTYGASPLWLQASASSGLAVAYRVVSGPAAVESNVLSITGAGEVVVEASQPGNASFQAAVSVQHSFRVAPAQLMFTVDDQGMFYGDTIPTLTGTYSGFVNGDDAGVLSTQPTFTIARAVGAPGSYVSNSSGAAATNYLISYVAGTLLVQQAISSVTLSPSATITSHEGVAVKFLVSVDNASGSGTPTGSVTFFDDGAELKSVDLVDGRASLTRSDWSLGNHILTVSYAGDVNFMANVSSATTLTVLPVGSAEVVGYVSLTTSATGDETYGQPISFTANVTLAGISGSPIGVVRFYDGSTLLATVPVVNGAASFTTHDLKSALHDATAIFVGSDDHEVSSQNLFVSIGVATPLLVGGSPDGTIRVITPLSGQTTTLQPFEAISTNVRTASGDVNGDGTPDIIAVTGPGTPIRVSVLSGTDGSVLVAPFDPFGGDFAGGGFVAAGDFDHDGQAEIVVTPDLSGGPRVVVYSVTAEGTTELRASLFGIDDPFFRGGARVTVGDVNGDGSPDLVVGAGVGGAPRVAIFDGASILSGKPTRLISDFFALTGADALTLRDGIFVAAGDVDGDGFADIAVGSGAGGAPRVLVLSGAMIATNNVGGAQADPVANFFVAGNDSDRGGVRLAVKAADGDDKADVIAGSGEGTHSRVRVYLGKNFSDSGEPGTFEEFDPFDAALSSGVFVG